MKYHIAREDEKIGEFTDLEISAGLREGQFRATDLCWAAGMDEWEPLSRHFPATEPAAQSAQADVRWEALDDAPHARPGDFELASRWLRFFAWIIDWITIVPASALFSRGLELEAFLAKNGNLEPEAFIDAYYAHIAAMVKAHPERFHLPVALLFGLLLINIVLLTLRGQTLGKWLAGVRIVKFQTGERAGFVSVILLRHVVMLVLFSIQYIALGLLVFDVACIFRRDRRCLHDMIADTMVVATRKQARVIGEI